MNDKSQLSLGNAYLRTIDEVAAHFNADLNGGRAINNRVNAVGTTGYQNKRNGGDAICTIMCCDIDARGGDNLSEVF